MRKSSPSSSDRKVSAKLTKLRGSETQMAFAKRLAISQSTLNRIENCEQSATVGLLDKLARKLNLRIVEFFR